MIRCNKHYIYEADMNEYFCPNCGAILNDQYGFDPSGGTWTCTVCGSFLMDDDIYEGDLYEGVAWYCDTCGALLNRQPGFSDTYSTWTCTECGYNNSNDMYATEEDYEEDLYEGIAWYCDICGALLNRQPGFSEIYSTWTCTECGYNNSNDMYATEEDSEEDYESSLYDYEWDDDESGSDDRTMISSSKNSMHHMPSKIYNVAEEHEENTKHDNIIILVLLIICGLLFGGLYLSNVHMINQHKINNEIKVTISSKELKKSNYEDAVIFFQSAGFENIELIRDDDLIFGWLTDDGSVESVTINGDSKFDSGEWFPQDAIIRITYHTFKEK